MSKRKAAGLGGLLAYSDSDAEESGGEVGNGAAEGPVDERGALTSLLGGAYNGNGDEHERDESPGSAEAAEEAEEAPVEGPARRPDPVERVCTPSLSGLADGVAEEVPVAHVPLEPRRQFVSVPEKYLGNVELPPAPEGNGRPEAQANT